MIRPSSVAIVDGAQLTSSGTVVEQMRDGDVGWSLEECSSTATTSEYAHYQLVVYDHHERYLTDDTMYQNAQRADDHI